MSFLTVGCWGVILHFYCSQLFAVRGESLNNCCRINSFYIRVCILFNVHCVAILGHIIHHSTINIERVKVDLFPCCRASKRIQFQLDATLSEVSNFLNWIASFECPKLNLYVCLIVYMCACNIQQLVELNWPAWYVIRLSVCRAFLCRLLLSRFQTSKH